MDHEADLLPVRAVNAFVFCPRLFWLEYVEMTFEDNEHTLEGSHVHRRVDKPGGSMPPPGGEADSAGEDPAGGRWHSRSLWLSDSGTGVSGKIDIVEEEDDVAGGVMPVDMKKGKAPEGEGLWPADEVQLVLQALLLRAAGYSVHRVAAWYHGSRRRVVVEIASEHEERARRAVVEARACVSGKRPPLPLVDSPRCEGCSLNPICLPDEVNALRSDHLLRKGEGALRRIRPPRDDALPLYVQSSGARVRLSKGCLKIHPSPRDDGEVKTVGMAQLSQVCLMGAVQITTQALQACLRAGIPVSFFSSGGWFYGRTEGLGNRQVQVRIAQFGAYRSVTALGLARTLVADKVANCRTMLRRNAGQDHGRDEVLARLKEIDDRVHRAEEAQTLLGLEGEAARCYWGVYSELLAGGDEAFRMKGRSRRPPRDPANALLSFGYSLLVKDCTLACLGAGLDPYLGMYHTPHHGRPSMALDLMEPFRPLIVDSVVLQLVKRREAKRSDFIFTGQAVAMKPRLRKALIQRYERRMDELVTHPVFGYRISYRQVLSVQARLTARALMGEIDSMPSFRTR